MEGKYIGKNGILGFKISSISSFILFSFSDNLSGFPLLFVILQFEFFNTEVALSSIIAYSIKIAS